MRYAPAGTGWRVNAPRESLCATATSSPEAACRSSMLASSTGSPDMRSLTMPAAWTGHDFGGVIEEALPAGLTVKM